MRYRATAALVAALATAAPAAAQSPSQSGMTTGMQTAPQGPPSDSPFLGSVPKGSATNQPLPLSVRDAVQRALENNLGLLLQEESERGVRGERWRALADLLPNVNGTLTEQRQVINLAAFGLPIQPPIVGPFNIFDARIAASTPIVDLSVFSASRAASFEQQAAKYGIKSARDLVVLVAVNLYLEAVATATRVDATHAQFDTAQALFNQAQDLKNAGIVAGIDVLRAQVQLQTQRQRVIAAENDSEKAKLQLARAIGVPVAQPIVLTDKIPYAPMPPVTLEQALKDAMSTRPDYLAAKARAQAAEAAAKAAQQALLPSLHFDGNWGFLGQNAASAHDTYSVAAIVRVPIFNANTTVGRRIETSSAARQAEAELADFQSRVEYEVRSSLLDVRAADQQLQAAQTNMQLANEELTQARDRFAAGVTSNLEVTQAQESVASATETYIGALYGHNLAKATLARALGIAETAVMNYLGGTQ